jgi:hypothetical protein
MSPLRAAAYLCGAVLLVGWLASAASVSRQRSFARPLPPTADAVMLDALASSVQSQASRLRQRLAAAPAPQDPIRNPFTFAARETRPQRAPRAVAAPMPAAPAPFEPELSLLGVAEDHTAPVVVRTAIIGGPGDALYMLKEGDALEGRYSVTAIGADGVELKDLATGAIRRLVLKSPA